MNKTVKVLVITFLVLLGLTGCGIETKTTVSGITFQQEDIGNKSETEIYALVQKAIRENSVDKKIILVDSRAEQKIFTLEALGIQAPVDENVQRIMQYGRSDNPFYNLWTAAQRLWSPQDLKIYYVINEPLLQGALKSMNSHLVAGGKNATLTVEAGKVVFSPAVQGQQIDLEILQTLLKARLAENDFSEINLPIKETTKPDITDEDLAGIDTVLSSYTTMYDVGNTSRTNNINIAASQVNHHLLRAGKTFSFNRVVGERTAEAGYDDAPVFLDGKLVPGIGGGICQVSSTIYAAALYSGMDIVERTPHYAPVGYIGLGLDATVSYGDLDLVLRNSFSHSVYFYVENAGGIITVYILGHNADKVKEVSLYEESRETVKRNKVEKIDSSLQKVVVEEGYDGLQLNMIRKIVFGNGETKRESILSYYDPKPDVITRPKEGELSDDEKAALKKERSEKKKDGDSSKDKKSEKKSKN